jgi:hypothetical protein
LRPTVWSEGRCGAAGTRSRRRGVAGRSGWPVAAGHPGRCCRPCWRRRWPTTSATTVARPHRPGRPTSITAVRLRRCAPRSARSARCHRRRRRGPWIRLNRCPVTLLTNFRDRNLAALIAMHDRRDGTAQRDRVGQCGRREAGFHPLVDGVADDSVGVHVFDREQV